MKKTKVVFLFCPEQKKVNRECKQTIGESCGE